MMIIMRRVYLDNDLILGKFLEPPESEVKPFKVFSCPGQLNRSHSQMLGKFEYGLPAKF